MAPKLDEVDHEPEVEEQHEDAEKSGGEEAAKRSPAKNPAATPQSKLEDDSVKPKKKRKRNEVELWFRDYKELWELWNATPLEYCEKVKKMRKEEIELFLRRTELVHDVVIALLQSL